MQYNAPVGAGSNDPYVTGVPGVTPGSIPPGPSIEYPQREIVSVISAAGITPSNGDLTQLLQALVAGYGMQQIKSPGGVLTLPGGWMGRFGSILLPANQNWQSVVLSIAFPTACAIVLPIGESGTGTTPPAAQNLTRFGCELAQMAIGSISSTHLVRYLALGY